MRRILTWNPLRPTSLLPPSSVRTNERITSSERLRLKVELALPALAMPGRILFEHPRARDLFPVYLATGYHVGRAMVPVMETALWRAQELAPNDPVAEGLAAYLERHIPEEMHSEEPGGAHLDDLEALGVDPVALRASLPPPKIAALIGAQYYWIFHHHPVALLGFLELEACYPHRPTLERLIEKTGLPPDGFRLLLLHSKLDVAHARELHRVLDSLPLEAHHEELIGLSTLQTIALWTEALLDVVEEKVAGPAMVTAGRATAPDSDAPLSKID
jgi:Iron-containing redox enzyme